MKTVDSSKHEAKQGSVTLKSTKGKLGHIIIIVIVGLAGLTYLSYATTRHITPASHFYSVKQFYQAVRIFLTQNPEAKANVFMQQTTENMNELQQLAKNHGTASLPYVISANLLVLHQDSTGGELHILKSQGVNIQPLVNIFCDTLDNYNVRFKAVRLAAPPLALDALTHAQQMTQENIRAADAW